jgi:hypothetical protein
MGGDGDGETRQKIYMPSPNNQVPLINGKAYDWASVSFMLASAKVVGVTAVSYADETEKENGYGVGQYPIDRGEGNYVPAPPTITLRAADNEALIERSPGRKIQDFGVFNIQVQFLVGTVKKTHTIRNCEFTGNSRSIKQGDKIINVEHTLICSHVEW